MDRMALLLGLAGVCAASSAGAQIRRHNFDLLDVNWKVVLADPAYTIRGDVTNTLVAEAGAKDIMLDCGRDLNISEVYVDGRKSSYRHEKDELHVPVNVGGGK